MPEASRLSGLYAITDETLTGPENFARQVELALKGEARIIQYRDKSTDAGRRLQQASTLKSLCDQYSALLIINDDIELAARVQADGVHLGEADHSITQARTRLGEAAIIGQSCYNQLDLALQAQAKGADYVAFGAFFSSATKPHARHASIELLSQAKTRLTIPVCTIGGIDENNAASLIDAGADMVAVINGLFAQPDIRKSAEHIAALFR